VEPNLHCHPYANEAKEIVMPGPGIAGPLLLVDFDPPAPTPSVIIQVMPMIIDLGKYSAFVKEMLLVESE